MKKRKILLVILLAIPLLIILFMGVNFLMKENAKRIICKKLEEQTGDKFRFIYGLDREWSIATNIRYRGILYSDNLENAKWPDGYEISLENLNINDGVIWQMATDYVGFIDTVVVEKTVEDEAIKIFGAKTNLYNDGSTTDYMYDIMMNKRGQKIPFEKKSSYYSTIVNVFVDDLNKLNNEDIREKTFELAKFIYNDMNYTTALQVYVRDNKYFEDYNLVYYSIYKPFRERNDIKTILGKIKNKEKLNEGEKVGLVRVFNKGGLDYENCHLKFFLISFDEKEEIPLILKNVNYEMENKNGEYIYFRKDNTNNE